MANLKCPTCGRAKIPHPVYRFQCTHVGEKGPHYFPFDPGFLVYAGIAGRRLWVGSSPLELEDPAPLKKAIKDSGRGGVVLEQLAPVFDGSIGRYEGGPKGRSSKCKMCQALQALSLSLRCSLP
jgi:hypothetical protein